MNSKIPKNIVGCLLILAAVALLVYDFFSPPVGELSNFTLIVFAKLMAIAGGLLNIDFQAVMKVFNKTSAEE